MRVILANRASATLATMATKYVCFILLNHVLQSINGQNPQQFSALQDTIADVSVWTYGDGPQGPRNWPRLFEQSCSRTYQSPIDINSRQTMYDSTLTPFAFFIDQPAPGSMFEVHNNGHAVEVNTKGQFYLANGGLNDIYQTVQFHFHWGAYSNRGSEHTIDLLRAPLEMHIVSFNQKYTDANEAGNFSDGLAVLSVLFRTSTQDNPYLEPIVRVLPQVRDPDAHALITIPPTSIKNLLPGAPDRYFRYQGSLTTPNCSESVIWSVFEQKNFISERQLNVFREMLTSSLHAETRTPQRQNSLGRPALPNEGRIRLVDNFRPLHGLNGRTVKRSFLSFNLDPALNNYNSGRSDPRPPRLRLFHSIKYHPPMYPPNYMPLLFYPLR